MQHWLAWWPTLFVVVVATFTDLRSRRVPNWLVLPFLVVGIVISPWRHDWDGVGHGLWLGNGQGFGWHGLGQSSAGFALGLVIYGILFWMGGMGAGDVKLCAAIGAWIGPVQLFVALIGISIVGGIMALCWAVFGGFLKDSIMSAGDLLFGWKRRGVLRDPDITLANPLKRKIPYAPAIAIGTLMSFFAR